MWTFHTHSNPGPIHQTRKKITSICKSSFYKHLLNKTTQSESRQPNDLVVIGFIREELWTHVVRGPYECAGHIILVLQYSCDAKIPNFDDVGLCQEDVLCFKIPVKNVPLMQVLQSKFTTVTSDALCPYKESELCLILMWRSLSISQHTWRAMAIWTNHSTTCLSGKSSPFCCLSL